MEKKLEKRALSMIKERLWTTQSAIRGFAGLFTQENKSPVLSREEFHGLGELLKKIADEIKELEEMICD